MPYLFQGVLGTPFFDFADDLCLLSAALRVVGVLGVIRPHVSAPDGGHEAGVDGVPVAANHNILAVPGLEGPGGHHVCTTIMIDWRGALVAE